MTKLPPKIDEPGTLQKPLDTEVWRSSQTSDQAGSHSGQGAQAVALPSYLQEVYHWAYLSATGRALFDHPMVVHAILWGNMHRLTDAVLEELQPGDRVLQPACVYGGFSGHLRRHIGDEGRLTVSDVAAVQVENVARKLAGRTNVELRIADAAQPPQGPFDKVACFFLLHEVPDDYKRRIVEALLKVLAEGGELVFVDYHRPVAWHPLRPLMSLIFDRLEPFAKTLWDHEIVSLFEDPSRLSFRKETYFGGLYQKVVVRVAPTAG